MLGYYNCTIVIKLIVTFDVPGRCATDMVVTPRTSSGGKKDLSSLTDLTNVDLGASSKSSTVCPSLCPSVIDSAPFIAKLFSIPVQSVSKRVGAALCSCVSRCRHIP